MTEYKFYNTLPDEARLIRTEVFVEEQGFREEFDSKDKECIHLVLFEDNIPAATGRIYRDSGKTYIAGRIAVRKSHRGKNLGSEVMRLLEEKARELGAEVLAVSAQCRAKGFYEKMGYTESGEIYLDEYCEHIHMGKRL